jgi:hypothetical protein
MPSAIFQLASQESVRPGRVPTAPNTVSFDEGASIAAKNDVAVFFMPTDLRVTNLPLR